jgi:hypothetical protein
MRRGLVWYIFTDVSEEQDAFILTVSPTGGQDKESSYHIWGLLKIINRRTHHKSVSKRQEQTIGDQLYDDLQDSESCDTTSHAQALPRSYISCQK